MGYPPPPSGNIPRNNAQERGWGTGWPLCQPKKQGWLRLSNGTSFEVRAEIVGLLKLLLDEVLRRGYFIRDLDSGGFNCRAIAGTTIPSNHSWGLAVDINWNTNPMSRTFVSDMPFWMPELMWEYGFFWGGWYDGTYDAMHYEFVGTPAQAAIYTTRARIAFTPKPSKKTVPDLVTGKEEDMLPYAMAHITVGPTKGRIYSLYGNGCTRWLGAAEYKWLKEAKSIAIISVTNQNEADRYDAARTDSV